MLKAAYPYYLGSEPVFANQDLEVTDKYSGKVATRVAMADAKAIDAGIAWQHEELAGWWERAGPWRTAAGGLPAESGRATEGGKPARQLTADR